MTSSAKMTKKVVTDGILGNEVPKLFTRHESKARYRGLASFGADSKTSVLLEVADTPELKARGLMGRTFMCPCCGMIFTNLDSGSFWMKGCLIPLDIVFIDDDGLVSQAFTMPADDGKKKYRYTENTAIELPAGFCKMHKITVGTPCKWRIWQ